MGQVRWYIVGRPLLANHGIAADRHADRARQDDAHLFFRMMVVGHKARVEAGEYHLGSLARDRLGVNTQSLVFKWHFTQVIVVCHHRLIYPIHL